MESRLLPLFAFLFLAVVVCDAALPSVVYWNTMLPGLPMPEVVRDLLHPGNMQKVLNDVASKDEVHDVGKRPDPNPPLFYSYYNTGKQQDSNPVGEKPGPNYVLSDLASKDEVHDAGKRPDPNPPLFYSYYNTGKQQDSNPVGEKPGPNYVLNDLASKDEVHDARKQPDPNPPLFYSYYNTGKQQDSNPVGEKLGPNYVLNDLASKDEVHDAGKRPDPNPPLFYSYYNTGKQQDLNPVGEKPGPNHVLNDVASKDEVHDHYNVFFLEKDLIPGRKIINVDLTVTTTGLNFLPRQLAEAIPFSMGKLTEIMEILSINPQSMEASAMEQTLKCCEASPNEGEEKQCATSLESMVDFVVSYLGKNVQSLSTHIGTVKQQYTSVERVGGSNSVVCHPSDYAYPVFHCHATHLTKVYMLPLASTKGNKCAISAICHLDTSKWDPEHQAFQVLKIKPGTDAVCHFLPEGHIVWTTGETSA